jgi:MarR family transcriptional regulator, organic hydroperoxide resistance regulator
LAWQARLAYDDAVTGIGETREIAGLLVALVGQTAAQVQHCAQQCGLSVVQASALLQIEGSMPMREFAARLGGHASNATGIADRLASRGLVQRHDDPGDRRVKCLGLTAAGTAARDKIAACIQDAPMPFARLSGEQRRQLRDLLLLALDPQTDLTDARLQAARLLGITLD